MKKLSSVLITLGVVIVVISFILFVLVFQGVFKEELNYNFQKISGAKDKAIEVKDKNFGIVIPKIGANASIIEGVDPFNANVYQRALTKGVAHALGSSLPNQEGNVFLFSHSSVNFYEASQYNSIFYLLSKLESGNEIDIYFKDKKYQYKVIEKKIVSANEVKYIKGDKDKKTLTLMTCWPAGTSLKRLLIIAELTH